MGVIGQNNRSNTGTLSQRNILQNKLVLINA